MANDNNLQVPFPWIFKQEQQKNELYTEINTHPVTGNDAHLCLFDKFQERNTTTKIEALRSNGNITESNGKFICRRIVSVCLAILWDWRLKS